MGVFGGALIFHEIPNQNRELMIYILGAVSGALTVGPASKAAEKAISSTGSDATINVTPSRAE